MLILSVISAIHIQSFNKSDKFGYDNIPMTVQIFETSIWRYWICMYSELFRAGVPIARRVEIVTPGFFWA